MEKNETLSEYAIRHHVPVQAVRLYDYLLAQPADWLRERDEAAKAVSRVEVREAFMGLRTRFEREVSWALGGIVQAVTATGLDAIINAMACAIEYAHDVWDPFYGLSRIFELVAWTFVYPTREVLGSPELLALVEYYKDIACTDWVAAS